ncbi:hypothetical protein Aph02nite_09540 [Actinoplanes philippinensis]|uniref:Capsular polysaccharide biosynthesis protein n=1 Tax=Actinoplanes philippinensis TaxID=35752 RepID=A0A1I2ACK7_9ACTN|nr:hypothetical protein [Actinoplanes philippinensis]GIE75004.1 hypothetical protein Aph02nite_09540 [Actinoplanes philippinensis]SFE40560.1 hypothetical protein SAMN05421541_101588 [Actinoplanes philippinensis]
MDLWDLTRLLLRRWYFAVPMLLVTVGVVVLAAKSVAPDYKAMGYMQLIPAPSAGKQPDPKAKPKPANPWLDLGYAALGNAAAITVTDPTNIEKLDKEGLSDSVTVVLSERTPLFEIEVIGDSEQQATATVQRVIKMLKDDIAAKQSQYGALEEDTISTLVINDGSAPLQDTGMRKRVLIVAAGLGVLVTTASTIILDYWLRRRSKSRNDGDDKDSSGAPPAEPVATAKSQPVRTSPPDDTERTQVLRPQPRQTNGFPAERNGSGAKPQGAARPSGRAPKVAPPVARQEESLDATIVIPSPSYPNRHGKRA